MGGFLLQIVRMAIWLALALAAAACVGFVLFAGHIARTSPSTVEKADAVVALTGGAQRLAAAADLLSSGQARRLFITGVNHSTTRADIARTFPDIAAAMECCVDLDYEAANTIGNAFQTQRWMDQHGYRSLILVTSAYHMPRTMVEFAASMPDIRISPYPVVSDAVLLDEWWADPPTLRILAGEYAKFLFAWARRRVMLYLAANDVVHPVAV